MHLLAQPQTLALSRGPQVTDTLMCALKVKLCHLSHSHLTEDTN